MITDADLKWIRRMAKSYWRANVELDDLVQEGVIGFLQVARDYDPSRQVAFRTFVGHRVRGAMADAIRSDAWPRQARLRRRAWYTLRDTLGRVPSDDEYATAIHTTPDIARDSVVRMVAMEASATYPGPPESESPESWMDRTMSADHLRAVVARLPPRLRHVIERHYFDGVPLSVIADELGVTDSRISQLRLEACKRLRRLLGEWQSLGTQKEKSHGVSRTGGEQAADDISPRPLRGRADGDLAAGGR